VTQFNMCSVAMSLFLVEVFSWFGYRVIRIAQSQFLSYSLKYFEISYGSLIFNTYVCRLGNDDNLNTGQSTSGIFVCAVCQVDLAPSEGISVHAGSIFSTSSKPWQGPFLCSDCRDKKDAMEGKRPSGVKVS